jgi:hypothetical protein
MVDKYTFLFPQTYTHVLCAYMSVGVHVGTSTHMYEQACIGTHMSTHASKRTYTHENNFNSLFKIILNCQKLLILLIFTVIFVSNF